MAKSNLPTNGLNEVSTEFAHDTIKSLNDLYNMGRPNSDDEVEQRIDEYFRFCEQSSIRPGVESLGLALSVSRTAIWNWEHGIDCSMRRQEIIIKAKSYITAYIEQCMLNNKMYPGSAIFMLKNWAGYKDTVEFTTEQNAGAQTPALSQEEIHRIAEQAKRESIPEIIESLPDE